MEPTDKQLAAAALIELRISELTDVLNERYPRESTPRPEAQALGAALMITGVNVLFTTGSQFHAIVEAMGQVWGELEAEEGKEECAKE